MNQKKIGFGSQVTFLVIISCILVFLFSVTFAVIKIKSSLMEASEHKTKEVIELAYNVISDYKSRADNGEFTEEQAKILALKNIKKFRYQGYNYVWVNDFNNKFLVHPTKPVGFDSSKIADKDGKHFFLELTELAKSGKEGFVTYKWTKPGQDSTKIYPKISTSKAFPEWGWVIATGVYVDEIDNKVLQTFWTILAGNFVVLIAVIALIQLTFVKKLNHSMNEITEDLIAGTTQLSETSYQLENASQKMAEGSSEQAASTQEISATLEETSSMVHKNNENTSQAAILAKQAKMNANNSHSEVEKMMKSMNEIKLSSNEISKIIKVIDEIAFQTNLLALNAAVEAARAGDAGKGFAVVAEEVRNLAQRSTQSAKDTTALIETNISLSEQGVDIAEEVYKSIAKIDLEAKKVSELLDEISVATNEQSLGVEQIHKAILQMEQVMHSSVQTADGIAAASEELFEQTTTMNNVVGKITTIINGDSSHKISYDKQKKLVSSSKKAHTPNLLSNNLSDF